MRLLSIVLAGLLLAVGPATAVASPITVSFSGTVSSADLLLDPTLATAMTLSGSFTYESSATPRSGATFNSAVFDSVSNVSLTVGGYSALASGSGLQEIQITNNDVTYHDIFALVSRAPSPLTGAAVNGFPLLGFILRLDDTSENALGAATALPTSLSLGSFTTSGFFLDFLDDNGTPANTQDDVTRGISGRFSQLSTQDVSEVPEPASLLLLASGLGLIGRRAVGRKTRTH